MHLLHICIIKRRNEVNQIKMKIKNSILAKVSDSTACRKLLKDALGVSQSSINRYIADNDDNLTKVAALKVIGEYFNLSQEEIIESENIAA